MSLNIQCPIELEYPFATRPRRASSLADSKLLRELGIGAVPASETGRPSVRMCRARSANSPWRTSTATASRPRTGAAICSNAAVSSFRPGPTTSKRTSERVVGHEVPTNFYRSLIRGPPPASSRRPVPMGPAFSVLSPASWAGPTTRSRILFHTSTISTRPK